MCLSTSRASSVSPHSIRNFGLSGKKINQPARSKLWTQIFVSKINQIQHAVTLPRDCTDRHKQIPTVKQKASVSDFNIQRNNYPSNAYGTQCVKLYLFINYIKCIPKSPGSRIMPIVQNISIQQRICSRYLVGWNSPRYGKQIPMAPATLCAIYLIYYKIFA